MLKHLINVASSLLRERGKRTKRSPQWAAVERKHLQAQPTCAACGTRTRVQVHHVKPFHLHPELELDPANLVSLCMDGPECHLRIGHGDDFKAFNPNVIADVSEVYLHKDRMQAVDDRAKTARQY